jgi:hypothetical protein
VNSRSGYNLEAPQLILTERQRELIARPHARGIDASESKDLLKQFEDSLVIFEEHLESMLLTDAPRRQISTLYNQP